MSVKLTVSRHYSRLRIDLKNEIEFMHDRVASINDASGSEVFPLDIRFDESKYILTSVGGKYYSLTGINLETKRISKIPENHMLDILNIPLEDLIRFLSKCEEMVDAAENEFFNR